MRPGKVLPIRNRVDLKVMAMKRYPKLLRISRSEVPIPDAIYCPLQDTIYACMYIY